jgi:NADP-dependent 3-hydroxy acid dehydrogenase YdfG
VVTGASKGIGLAVAQELAGEGSLVIAGARSIATLEGIENVTPHSQRQRLELHHRRRPHQDHVSHTRRVRCESDQDRRIGDDTSRA